MDSPRKTTMKDVAAYCGVSSMAVSKVLSGKGGISKETAERILAAAKKLNYTPNLIAKSLRVNETKTLGLVISDSSHLLFAKMLKAISDAAERMEYSIIIANTDQNPEREKNAINVLLNKRIDGLLLAAPIHPDSIGPAAGNFGVPVTLLMRKGDPEIDTVITDNFKGGYEMVDYLVKTGSDRVHMIDLPKTSQAGRDRLRGYRRALRDNGITPDASWVTYCEPYIEDGYRSMRELLDGGLKSGSVFCGCDVIAVGAMRAIAERGLRIPEDFRLCGFDDIELLDCLMAPLTTMRQPVYEMGRQGVNILLERIKNPRKKPTQLVMSSELIVRAST